MKTASARPTFSSIGAGLAAAALLLAGCSASTDRAPSWTEPVTVRVGEVGGFPLGLLLFAVDQGIFADQGLDVQVVPNASGADAAVALQGGAFDIAGGPIELVVLARADPEALVAHVEKLELIGFGRTEEVPFRIIGTSLRAATDPATDFSQVLVAEDSPIRNPADLDGHTVAVENSSYLGEVAIRRALENAGATHSEIEFVEIDVPEMIPELLRGAVDAVQAAEPFLSRGLDAGLRPVLAPYASTQPGMAVGSYYSSDEFIDQNPDVVDRFAAGLDAAGEYVADHPDELRAELAGDLDPEVAAAVNLPGWGGPLDVASVELIGDLTVRFGLLEQPPPTDQVVYLP